MKTAIDRFDILIKKIAKFRPMSHIIATTLIKKKEPENNEINRLFNPYVEDIVNNNAADGVRISFYDMYPVVPFDELIDGIHPSKVGYGLMADAWLQAIQALQNDRPPELTGAIAYIGSNIVTLVLSTAITDSSLNDISNFGISNGIVVEGATLRKDKRQIDLQTSDFSQYVGTTLNAVIVGGKEGKGEGFLVGDLVGSVLGVFVGDLVGRWEGDVEGDSEGAAEGISVGDLVGSLVVGAHCGDNVSGSLAFLLFLLFNVDFSLFDFLLFDFSLFTDFKEHFIDFDFDFFVFFVFSDFSDLLSFENFDVLSWPFPLPNPFNLRLGTPLWIDTLSADIDINVDMTTIAAATKFTFHMILRLVS